MSDVTIYGSRLSPFVEKVCRAAAYKQISFTLEDLGLTDLPKVNPTTKKIPILKVDGETIYDSTFILRKLDALKPDPPLYEPDAEVGAAQRQLEDWSDESLYWQIMALAFQPTRTSTTTVRSRCRHSFRRRRDPLPSFSCVA